MKTPIILFLLISLVSCNSKKEDSQTEKAFSDLAKRYDALKIPADSVYSSYYDHLISFDNHKVKMKFEIFQRKDEKESFVLMVEYRNKMRAIPVFPYGNKCYWNYENEKNNCGSSTLNFQNEYNQMLRDLSLDDSSKLILYPYSIISNNILSHETLRSQDSTDILNEDQWCIDAKEKSFVEKRNQKNLRDLMRLIYPTEHVQRFFAEKDPWSEHVFLVEKRKKPNGKTELVFMAFNFTCVEPTPIYM
jgi:hypothetical protein